MPVLGWSGTSAQELFAMSATITGAQAKRAREAKALSQTAVAGTIGVNRTYYSLFEAGRYNLDDDERQRLCDLLADSTQDADSDDPADPDSDPDPDTGSDSDDDGDANAPSAAPAVSGPMPAPRSTAATVAALTALRNASAEPNGLRSKRTAAAVLAVAVTIQPLDYTDLLGIARERAVPTQGLPSFDAFKSLDLAGMTLWESRAIGLLICDSLYDGRWKSLRFDSLKDVESSLRETLGDGAVSYEGATILSLLFNGDDHHAPLRRAELAPFVVQAAQKRAAPAITGAAKTARADAA
jgi:transcriptional regulator with XRE-family HTH domain